MSRGVRGAWCRVHGAACLVLAAAGVVLGAAAQTPRAITALPPRIENRQAQPLTEGTRRGVRLDARANEGVAWWPDVSLGDGTIELDLRGKDVAQQSFLGVAFHGVDEKTFDDVYFRPFNFKAANAVSRSHAVQYEAHPGFTWDKLRLDRPDQFERGIPAPPDPNGWFHARIVLAYPVVRVFVNDTPAPVMEVNQLSDRKTGWIGVWVGNNSDGDFANITVK